MNATMMAMTTTPATLPPTIPTSVPVLMALELACEVCKESIWEVVVVAAEVLEDGSGVVVVVVELSVGIVLED
jgi:hypothetical protein